ncbi:zinc finger protein 655 isoform X9 [Erinaceus europaeus]|uniref:Zinc finger protein 655 isoform X9 n=1 Tax=Erinaceus europaeus TaxID=9365 RepID=A0ABM3VYC5_ERIEU|nr:zinc finger protein 655 isoform X9 [Erinaceus europaeus]
MYSLQGPPPGSHMQDPLHGALIRGQSASPRTPFPVGPRPRKCHRDALASCGPKRPPPPPQRLWRLRPPEPGWSLSSGAVMEELLAQETAALPSRQFQGVEAHLGHLSPEPQFGQDTDMEQGLTEGISLTGCRDDACSHKKVFRVVSGKAPEVN